MIPRILALIAQAVLGLSLMYFGAINVHTEMERPVPPGTSTVRLSIFLAIGLLGAFVLPSIGDVILAKARAGVRVAVAGRRAYDGKILVEESTEPHAPTEGV